jgi:predicted DNA-binding transcriptional regulator YafY
MNTEEATKVVEEARRLSRVVEVDYVRHDGVRTIRLLEPFDVGPGVRSKTGENKFWGWCIEHDRVEQRTLSNIVSMRITDQEFDPKEHEKYFDPQSA